MGRLKTIEQQINHTTLYRNVQRFFYLTALNIIPAPA